MIDRKSAIELTKKNIDTPRERLNQIMKLIEGEISKACRLGDFFLEYDFGEYCSRDKSTIIEELKSRGFDVHVPLFPKRIPSNYRTIKISWDENMD
jgi:hypothetical protein